MSYKTWVNDYQIFGNNDYSEELINELKRQGMNEPDDDFIYSFEIKDINPVIKAVEKYLEQEIEKREKRGINRKRAFVFEYARFNKVRYYFSIL